MKVRILILDGTDTIVVNYASKMFMYGKLLVNVLTAKNLKKSGMLRC